VRGRTYPYPSGESTAGANLAGVADGYARHAPTGVTPAGVNGLHDMAGNLWEWLADARGDERLTAGGSWWYGSAQTQREGMQYKPAAFYAVYVGFRCVYSGP
jgi:formylglycine-generating enzyme required for sulfatase activity